MAKRRTRKEKEKAKHQFTFSWQPQSEATSEANVKRQFQDKDKVEKSEIKMKESADYLTKGDDIREVKRDVSRSLILALVILGLEVVIYLAWS